MYSATSHEAAARPPPPPPPRASLTPVPAHDMPEAYDTDLEVDHERAVGMPAAIRQALRNRHSKFRPGGERGDPAACIRLVFPYGCDLGANN